MKSEDEIFRMFEFQEKERIFPKKCLNFREKKEFSPKFLTKLLNEPDRQYSKGPPRAHHRFWIHQNKCLKFFFRIQTSMFLE